MRKALNTVCVMILTFMFSACATFKNAEEADSFLAAENAKAVKCETKVWNVKVAPNPPKENAGDYAFTLLSNPGSKLIQIAPELIALKVVAGSVRAIKDAVSPNEINQPEIPDEAMWIRVSAKTNYGHYVEIGRGGLKERKPPTIFDKAIKEVGVPPKPCAMIGQVFGYDSKKIKWFNDEAKGIQRLFADKLQYGVLYMTILPNDAVQGQTPAICTQEMAGDHFNKIVKIVENP